DPVAHILGDEASNPDARELQYREGGSRVAVQVVSRASGQVLEFVQLPFTRDNALSGAPCLLDHSTHAKSAAVPHPIQAQRGAQVLERAAGDQGGLLIAVTEQDFTPGLSIAGRGNLPVGPVVPGRDA